MSELDVQRLIKKYLSEAKIMQLATVSDGRPWISSLHFVSGEDGSMYWLSKETKRHSTDIVANPQVAIAIVIKTEKPLVGIQAEGTAGVVTDKEQLHDIMKKYVEHHSTDQAFADQIAAGTNEHKVYVFHPEHFCLLDQEQFSDRPLQEWVIDRR
jgi:uncharacterized protein YhbP (UPF0306 family)